MGEYERPREVEYDKEKEAANKKIVMISVAAGLGTLFVAALIWYLIFSSQFAVFSDDVHNLRIKYPKAWTVMKDYAGTIVTFVSPKEGGLDAFQENLNIAVLDLSKNPMTLEQYTKIATHQMDVVFENNIEVVVSKDIWYAGQTAHEYVVKATNPQEVIMKVIWFIKNNRAYTITYAAEMIQYESKYLSKFNEMLRSFSFPAQ